jgi:hypothetical protein
MTADKTKNKNKKGVQNGKNDTKTNKTNKRKRYHKQPTHSRNTFYRKILRRLWDEWRLAGRQ